MLAAIFIEIVPETVGIWTDGRTGKAAAGAVLGAMTLLLVDPAVVPLVDGLVLDAVPGPPETGEEPRLRFRLPRECDAR